MLQSLELYFIKPSGQRIAISPIARGWRAWPVSSVCEAGKYGGPFWFKYKNFEGSYDSAGHQIEDLIRFAILITYNCKFRIKGDFQNEDGENLGEALLHHATKLHPFEGYEPNIQERYEIINI